VSFTPFSFSSFAMEMHVLSSSNDKYVIRIHAEGLECPLEVSSPVIIMRTTQPGERVLESTFIQNKSSYHQFFEIVTPDPRFSWVKVAPAVLDLGPGQSGRVEFEFLPPTDLTELDPIEWYKSTQLEVQRDGVSGTDVNGKVNNCIHAPFDDWIEDSGWAIGKGLFGDLQWVKAGAGTRKPKADEVITTGDGTDPVIQATPTSPEETEIDVDDDLPEDVPEDEWGISGKWRFPLFIQSKTGGNTKVVEPLFLRLETSVTLPQIEASSKMIDFGQLAVGTRQVKSIKVYNRGYEYFNMHSSGINAIGPYTILNYMRSIAPGSSAIILVECEPARPGLITEVLELFNQKDIGGHRLRISIRSHAIMPSIELQGLLPPPANWNQRSGLLDFGNVVATDVSVLKFVIANKSSFGVEANIIRTATAKLTSSLQAEYIDRTISGLPVITYRPEKVTIAPGSTQTIEVIFRPDRERFEPYREDLDIVVGRTDEILRVGVCGRAWSRQMIVTPNNPLDEAFAKPQSSITAPVENLLINHNVFDVRKLAFDALNSFALKPFPLPAIRLEFPDPFAIDVDSSTYITNESNTSTAPAAGGKAPAGKPIAPVIPPGSRQQIRKLCISCAKILDGRAGAGNGTFEIILGPTAKTSGLFSLNPDKGAVSAGGSVTTDILCTLPKPRGVGGLAVGSWQEFTAEVVTKGGWIPQGEVDEKRTTISLRAFISL